MAKLASNRDSRRAIAPLAVNERADAEAHLIAAYQHEAKGEPAQAERIYRAGLEIFPDHAALAVNLARLLRQSTQTLDEAVRLLHRTVEKQPDYPPARLSLIETLRTAVGRPAEAEAQARVYVGRYPADGNGHLCLALALYNQGRLSDALVSAERSTALPGKPEHAWELKADIHVALGDPVGAMESYRGLLELQRDAEIHSRLLVAMQYCDTLDEAEILEETRCWVSEYDGGVMGRTCWPRLDFDSGRALKVGFVSGDFRQCSTPLLALPLFEHWPEDWTVSLYSNSAQCDEWTSRFRRTAAYWVDIYSLDDDLAAARIIEDRIDVLVDLNGHTLGGRLGIFRRKPAPVQLAWLNLAGTTGLSTFDAIIADAWHLPRMDQPSYAEPIRHVTDNRYRYLPLQGAPEVTEGPVVRNGFVTFGSFNSAYKVSQTTLSRWAAILKALPTARLMLNAREFACRDTIDRFARSFEQQGIAPSRIDFRPGSRDPLGMLAAYREIDIALDSFPYSGGLTTLEALYMGVPVITAPGKRLASRHSCAHLRTMKMADWIAYDDSSYVELAVQKASAFAELSELRSSLRARLNSSALVDGPAFSRDLSGIVRDLWRSACSRVR